MAEVAITVLYGWYNEPVLRSQVQTRYGSTVSGNCECSTSTANKWRMVDAKADIQIAITMNPNSIAGVKPSRVMGHEQMHVNKVKEAVESLRPEIQAELQAAEGMEYEQM